VSPLTSYVFEARDSKVQELKQTSGNSDVSTGTTASGVTAASAISQLIETGSKGSRHLLKGTYRCYRKIIYLVIERMRQFYDEPRYVRILDEDGSMSFDTYNNAGLVPQQMQAMDGSMIERYPMFDIEVASQKASPYNKMSQNELALQFYQYQFFNPQNADATLACLNMMDFDHKEDVISQVSQNQNLLMMVQQLQEENEKLKVLANLYVPNANFEVGGVSPNDNGGGASTGATAPNQDEQQKALGKTDNSINQGDGTNSQAEQYRQRVADSTEV
jgi:hypothetical protein